MDYLTVNNFCLICDIYADIIQLAVAFLARDQIVFSSIRVASAIHDHLAASLVPHRLHTDKPLSVMRYLKYFLNIDNFLKKLFDFKLIVKVTYESILDTRVGGTAAARNQNMPTVQSLNAVEWKIHSRKQSTLFLGHFDAFCQQISQEKPRKLG